MKTALTLVGLFGLCVPVMAQGTSAPAPGPLAKINLLGRTAKATPTRVGFTHTGAGNIDVSQPSADTVVVTLAAVAVAGGHPCKGSLASVVFDLEQCFEVEYEPRAVKSVKLTLEARLIGLLRSHAKGGGTAEVTCGQASVIAGTASLLAISTPTHAVAGGENLSVNDRVGPEAVGVIPGKYALHQSFTVSATHPKAILPCKAASAEFAPDPALDPLWISAFEPFRGAQKKDFGLQVTLKVVAEEADKKDEKKNTDNGKKDEKEEKKDKDSKK